MNRDDLLAKLAMELPGWPKDTTTLDQFLRPYWDCSEYRGVIKDRGEWPIICGWKIYREDWIAERARIASQLGYAEVTPEEDEAWSAFDESRIDRIAQSDGSGDHYGVGDGRKFDTDKPMMGLIPPLAEEALARVLTFGAKKYAPDNWRKVEDKERRYMDAMLRHLNAHRRGEKEDPETGESHLAHAACCVMFMLELEEESKQ